MEEPGCLPESSGMSRAWCVQMPRQRAGHWWAGRRASLSPPRSLGWGSRGSEGITGTVSSLQQINQQINFSDAQLVVLSNPAVLPVCRFHFAAGLGKQGSASVPGPAREQSSGAGERRAEASAGGQAGRRCMYGGRGVEERKSRPRVCMHTLVSASISVLCVHLCRCICVSVCAYVCSVRLGICVCVGGWVRWAGNGYGG